MADFNSEGKIIFHKVCAYCRKSFDSTSRRQKFCCSSCQQKAQKKHIKQQRYYNEVKSVERLRVRSHSLAVDLLKESYFILNKSWVCECCGHSSDLHVHHKDLNWANNSLSNLQLLCTKCHSKAHASLESNLNQQGILLDEYYEPSMKHIFDILNKR